MNENIKEILRSWSRLKIYLLWLCVKCPQQNMTWGLDRQWNFGWVILRDLVYVMVSVLDWLNILDSWEVMKSKTWDMNRGPGLGRRVIRSCIISSVLPAFLFSCFQGPTRPAHTANTIVFWPCTQSQAPWTGSCETRSWSEPSSLELLMSSICHRETRKLMSSALLAREILVNI